MCKKIIYLDHHATTPLDPRVLDAMLPYFGEKYGNASSRTHKLGWDAEEAVEDAREQVAKLISCSPDHIIFTSGTTESNNMILKLHGLQSIVTSTIEHSSIINVCDYLSNNKEISFITPNKHGVLNPEKICTAPDLLSIMMVNNEIGTIQDIAGFGSLASKHSNMLFHSDAAQAVGKFSIDVGKLNVDFLSFSAHKLYGPKGIGALFFRDEELLEPLIHGGPHERGKRSGTLNVPAIVGFGKACEIAAEEMDHTMYKITIMREILLEELCFLLPGIKYHHFHPQVSGSLHVSLPCNDMTMLFGILGDKVAISSTSACMSINNQSSRVVREFLSDEEAQRSVRFCVGRFNTINEVREAAHYIAEAVKTVNLEV